MKKLRIPMNKALHCGCLIATVGYFFSIQHLPLLGSFGAESGSLFSALFGPLFAFVAILKLDADKRGFAERFNQLGPMVLFYSALFSALIFLNTVFKQSCSEASGFLWFLAFLLPPLILNVLLGTVVSCFASKKRIRLVLLLLFYVVYFGVVIYSWWQEPVFRLFSHLSIVFTSDLLSGIILNDAVLVFRLSTLVWCFFFYQAFALLFPSYLARIYGGHRKNFIALVMPLFFAASALILQTQSIKLAGKSYRDLAADYSLSMAKNGIVVKASPTALRKDDVQSVLNDALFWQHKLKQKLGITSSTKPITIWLHKTAEDKFVYTGARHVHFALPHRREIHISGIEIPHPVLGHELAHIFLGEFSDNRLKIPGISDWLPNLGISEGLASYLTQELNVEDEESIGEMAQALWQSNIRIDLPNLFSINPLHFAKLNSGVAYLFAGAFFDFYLSKKPLEEQASIIKNLVKNGTLNLAIPPEKQEAIFQDFVRKLEEPARPQALALVNMRWQKEGILTKNCMKDEDNTLVTLRKYLWLDDFSLANEPLKTFAKDNALIALNEAKYWLSNNRPQASLQIIHPIDVDKLDLYQKNTFYLLKTRILIALGYYAEAKEALNLVTTDLLTHNHHRYALLLHILLDSSFEEPGVKESLNYLANPPQGNNNLYFAYSIGSFNLGGYLLARLLMFDGDPEHASKVLTTFFADSAFVPETIQNEALWMNATLSFALKHFDEALEALNRLLTKDLPKGRMLEAKDLSLRIEFIKSET